MTTVPAVDTTWSKMTLAERREPPTRRGQAHETTRRLIAGSLAGLLIFALAGYFVGARLAERQVLTDAQRFSALMANVVVGPRLTPAVLAGDPGARAQLDRALDRWLRKGTSPLCRVKVWSSDGRILYSDEPSEIGDAFRLTSAQRTTLRTGEQVAEVSDLERRESALERPLGDRLLELYTRYDPDDGPPVLVETYMSYDQVKEQRATVFTWLSVLAATGFVLFAAFQVTLGRLNLRWVRRRQEELDEKARLVSERARQRVARDLHDGPVQDLVGASYVVDGALQSVRGRGLAHSERLLEGAAESVRNSIHSLRSVMIEVYPRTIHDRGLAGALNDLAQPMRTRGLDVEVSVTIDAPLSHEASEALFRCAQEAARNVMHHAKARTAQIRVEPAEDAEYVTMLVIDDGIGLAPDRIPSPGGHLGLRAITDIVVERHGSLQIWSAPGKGTQLRMEMLR
jgi:signal transduction histidine kinase